MPDGDPGTAAVDVTGSWVRGSNRSRAAEITHRRFAAMHHDVGHRGQIGRRRHVGSTHRLVMDCGRNSAIMSAMTINKGGT
jgi:hypothetical protein